MARACTKNQSFGVPLFSVTPSRGDQNLLAEINKKKTKIEYRYVSVVSSRSPLCENKRRTIDEELGSVRTMAKRSDEVRAFAAPAHPILLEHDYADCFRNNNDNKKNVNENKENVYRTSNKFHATFDAVDKWADSVIMREPIGHDRRKIVDREITIHKVKYPFLPEQQIRGKVYRKFGIPTLMGGVSSRDVATLSGSSTKDRPKRRRRDRRRSNIRRGSATTSQDYLTTDDLPSSETSRSSPGSGSREDEQNLSGLQNHPQYLLISEQSTDKLAYEEMSPPTVSSRIRKVSDGEPQDPENTEVPLKEQEFLRILELGEKSPDSSLSDTLVSPLNLEQLSLNDKVTLPDAMAQQSSKQKCISASETSESCSQESIHSQVTLVLDGEDQLGWRSKKVDVIADKVFVNRARSTRSLESLDIYANASLEDLPTQTRLSSPIMDLDSTNATNNYHWNSSFRRRKDFLPMSSDAKSLNVNELTLLEKVRSVGKAFIRKFDGTSSNWELQQNYRVEERTKDQRGMKKSLSALGNSLNLRLGVKKVDEEGIVSQNSWTYKQPKVHNSRSLMDNEQPEVLHSREFMANRQPEMVDTRHSSVGKQPEALSSQSSSHDVVGLDHAYSGGRLSKNTGSEQFYGRKRGRMESKNTSRKIMKIDGLENASSNTWISGEVWSSDDKENSTDILGCLQKNEKNTHDGYSLLDDSFVSPFNVASSLSTDKPKQTKHTLMSDFTDSKNAIKNVMSSTVIRNPEVHTKFVKKLDFGDSPKNLDVMSSTVIRNPEVHTKFVKKLDFGDSPKNLDVSSPMNFLQDTDTRLLHSVDLLSNHCCEYDQELATDAKLYDDANEFRSWEKIRLEKLRVSSPEMAKKIQQILLFLENDCVDF